MSLTQDAAYARQSASRWTVSTGSLSNGLLAFVVFLGGFVFFEPAPYELVILPMLVVWFAFGLTFKRGFLPLTFFLLCFVCGGFIAATQKADVGGAFFYVIVTAFLATTAIFFAAVTSERTLDRVSIIFRAYIAAAIVSALVAILAYARIMPNAEAFLFGGRAKGTFEDPNVFGPFLALPAVYLFRKMLVEPISKNLSSLFALLLLLAAIFLAFSRAAWGLAFLTFAMMAFVVFVSSPTKKLRTKIILMVIGAVFAAVIGLVGLLQIEAVASLFEERARLIQSYDGARFGRFARYTYGIQWIMETPLGFGFGKFRETFGEDAHNVFIKSFMVYGWLGGIAFLSLIITTLVFGFKQLFKDTPWQAYFQACYIVIIGHLMVGMVVDTDRWRHLYLIYGLLWGMMAANAMRKRLPPVRLASRRAP